MESHTPHKALLALHRLVDDAIEELLGAMGLDRATESIVEVDRADLVALSGGMDPISALVSIEPGPDTPAMLIAEPALANAILARIWRSERSLGAPLTQVEHAILLQFLRDVSSQWYVAWRHAGVDVLPSLSMAASLSMLSAQMVEGPWYVARTVVLDGNEAVGVLLFCYPAGVLPTLVQARQAISWRHRIERGLTDGEREQLHEKVRRFTALHIPAPVRLQMNVPLGLINQLERGDVLGFDALPAGDLPLQVLDREVTARLGRSGERLALTVTGPDGEYAPGDAPAQEDFPQYADGGDWTEQPETSDEIPSLY